MKPSRTKKPKQTNTSTPGATFLEALRNGCTGGTTSMDEVIRAFPELAAHLVRHASGEFLSMLEQLGKMATAAKAGDSRACTWAARYLDKIAGRTSESLKAELARMGLTVQDLAAAFLNNPLLPGPGDALA